MKVTEVRSEEELRPMRAAWDHLVCETASKSIFLTWEWATAWWSAYGKPGDLRVLTAVDDAGVLRGIAPLRERVVRRYGQQSPALAFIGDAPTECDSDYLDFIAAPGWEKQVIEAFHRHCAGALAGGTVLLLNEIPAASPSVAVLRELAAAAGMDLVETDVPCATVQLPETWEAYLGMLKPRFRTKVRSVLRNLESRPEVTCRFCEDAGELPRILPALFELHTRRWNVDGKPGVFGGGEKREFYFALSRLLLERGWLRLSWLEWKGQILACQYGFAYGGTYSQLQEGYEPVAEHWNLGIGLRAWSIRDFLKEGLREYDFLGGVNRHKTDWGAEVKHSKRILLADRSFKNLLVRRGPEWEKAARSRVRAIVPENVLAAREAQKDRPAAKGNGLGWLRQAMAECYFRSGAPALTRGLRERYQLRIDGRRIGCRKRTETSVRILYYHGVNDERHPFFDAISTSLFEQQMRYLARHYKVVPLAEATRLLEEGGRPEMVVAVTFDDGYRDNYENAFPILNRYGLPATIFLTTGSLDSGEPLWFEQLAEAIQKTTREYIDLEFDIPRRFWLRTEAERLESKRRIFGLLRQMDTAACQERLEEVRRLLGPVAASERRNRMLTWDQVRKMKANGIDFGGHTVTHPFLSRLAPDKALWEVTECKRRIEEELQQPAGYFAYPNGQPEDFAASNKELLRAAGYRAAVTTIWGMNYQSSDRMELRRGGPWESSPALFASKLDWYQWVNQ
jgi:peptidoglycan/xylan/chitin deacetylase (PgdA/CDA1 family)/CelD/BcsL family acetyltransferase involved in cellulose biosynthesis